jgi:hypothetical protein
MASRDRETASDRRTTDNANINPTASASPTRPPLDEIRPAQVTTNDEAGDPSAANAENPTLVREEVKNTSDSSGLHVDDEARGELIKEQLKRGLREIQPLD